ncbi:MAG: Peroxiredoxin [Acidimicrobiales bacterium]|nr:Peroxiredoxin [Acidimicrobiales bacterium]
MGVAPGEDDARLFSLDDYRGQPVVLVFYPADDSPVCTRQLGTYTEDIGAFREVNAQILAISPQSTDSHRSFSEKRGGFAFPLLSDEGKAVGAAYGILGLLGLYRRSAFVIDAEGTITYAHRSIGGLSFRPTGELVAAVGAQPPRGTDP